MLNALRLARLRGDKGSVTIEYAMIIAVAVAFVGALLLVAKSEQFRSRLAGYVMEQLR